ncbi:signal transduction histidine-protein kinase BaeS [mine drainage metagenome]|uniref:histidine kinase n=1 Tax=mine drainage metagenome TaxID=410659 RepID=A0A1J5QIF6_9ZZZZ
MSSARLVIKLLFAQLMILTVAAITLIVTALIFAPGLFAMHLRQSGGATVQIEKHTREAFVSSISLALAFASIAALLAAGLISWLLARRVASPIEQLADAADAVARRENVPELPEGGFSVEFRRLNESFNRMAKDLASSEQSRRHLLSDLAHELRTPIATIRAYVDALEDGVAPASPETWETLRQQTSRMERLVSDLKDASAADENVLTMIFTRVDLVEIVRSTANSFQPRCELAGKNLRVLVADTPIWIKGDSSRLEQVLSNLLDNACRHTPSGGDIEVRTKSENGTALVQVSDSGEGIPTDQLDIIFQRFYQLDPSRKRSDGGSGLGLTIARAITERHGGSLEADGSGPLGGATFTIRIPTIR